MPQSHTHFMPLEIELKLEISATAAARLAHAPWLRSIATGVANKEKLVSVYYDTDDLALHNRRAVLRVRKTGRKYIQGLKLENNAGQGAVGRSERECELGDAHPDLRKLERNGLNGLHPTKLEGKLKPVFETTVMRTAIPLRWDGSDLEVVIDVGVVKTRRRQIPIHEVEVELKSGKPASMIAVGERIAESLKATYGIESKAERGYALREGKTCAAAYASCIVLEPPMTTAEAFKIIGLSCLHHFAANRGAVSAGDREGVHQMRVGLRRLRAAFSIFKDMLRDSETEAIKQELEWLANQLGPARDLDVLIDNTIASLEKQDVDPVAVGVLKKEVARKRAAALTRARAAVRSDRCRRLVLRTAFWVVGGSWAMIDDPLMNARRQQEIAGFAAAQLTRRQRKIVDNLERLKKLDPGKRHKVRIAVKKLRYATEFFESLFSGRVASTRRKAFGKALKSLQSSLGELNDIHVHGILAADFVASNSALKRRIPEAFAMGLIAGEKHAESARLLSDANKVGKRLAAIKPFWKKY